jgi:hypothetical protein
MSTAAEPHAPRDDRVPRRTDHPLEFTLDAAAVPALAARILRARPAAKHLAEHQRSIRRWMVPFAILVIAAVIVFIVVLARPDL